MLLVRPADPVGMSADDPEALARGYYRALDEGDYDALTAVLTPEFRQVREDRVLDGRDAFVGFMRDDRPATDTTHAVEAVYTSSADDPDEIAVRGRLHGADGSVWFGFVDVFGVADGRLDSLVTYSNSNLD